MNTQIKPVGQSPELPHPIVKNKKLVPLLIWLIPVAALIAAGFYFRDYLADHGRTVTVRFADTAGIRVRDTPVIYRGVSIGHVEGIALSEDHHSVEVQIQMKKGQDDFARKGAEFWILRPEISEGGLSGLSTVFTGPHIEATPGSGEEALEFTGLGKPPVHFGEGLHLVLHTPRMEHVQSQSPIYYRGFEVGTVRDVQMARDADRINIDVVIWRRYEKLVKAHSRFWMISGVDVKGGIFSGLEFKLNSLRTLMSGGIAFATPEKDQGGDVRDLAEFNLEADSKKEWLDWAPKIPTGGGSAEAAERKEALPTRERIKTDSTAKHSRP